MNQKILNIIPVIAILWAQTAFAAPGLFTSYPTHTTDGSKWINREVNPGGSYQEGITLENLDDSPITLTLQVIESTGDKNNIRLLENQEYKDIGNWVSTENNSVQLAAHEKKSIVLNINIPSTALIGDYQAVLLVTNTDRASSGMNIATRIGNRIYLKVTNSKTLQGNTFNLTPSIYQITALLLSSLALFYGLKPTKKLANQKQSL